MLTMCGAPTVCWLHYDDERGSYSRMSQLDGWYLVCKVCDEDKMVHCKNCAYTTCNERAKDTMAMSGLECSGYCCDICGKPPGQCTAIDTDHLREWKACHHVY